MVFKKAYLLPVITTVWFPLTFLLTYAIASIRKDVSPIFPYISDTGNWAPESCLFGIMLTFGSIFMILEVYINYRMVRDMCEKGMFETIVEKLNRVSAYIGTVACVGIIVVANFQETSLFIVHIIGAIMSFGGAALYLNIQVYISFKMYPAYGSKPIIIFRTVFAVISAISFVLCVIFTALAIFQFNGEDLTKWKHEDGGYHFRILSSIFEWLVSMTIFISLCSYTFEFRRLHFEESKIIVIPNT